MLIAEDLLLLLTEDTKGRLSGDTVEVDIMLAGANLVELVLMGRIDVSRLVEPVRLGRIHWDDRKIDRLIVGDSSPTGDAVLDAALEIALRGQSVGELSWVIREPGKSLRRTLYERLVSSGMIRHERRRTLAVLRSTGGRLRIPATRWRCADG